MVGEWRRVCDENGWNDAVDGAGVSLATHSTSHDDDDDDDGQSASRADLRHGIRR